MELTNADIQRGLKLLAQEKGGALELTSADLQRGLEFLVQEQKKVNPSMGASFYAQDDWMKTFIIALQTEVAELANELPWRPWRQEHTDVEKVTKEFVDILAFIPCMYLVLRARLGISIPDIVKQYERVVEDNKKRLRGEIPGFKAI